MSLLFLGRRRTGVVASVLVAGLVVLCTAALTGAFAGTSNTAQTTSARQQFAQHLLKTGAAQLMTWPAQAFLRIQATGDRQLTPALAGRPALPSGTTSGAAAPAVPSANLSNVRVNNPAEDTHQADQTTQSETTIAVAGSHVAVGYNDSQQTGLVFTAGSDITGYSYSADGGASFTDGGVLPNAPEFNNLGDPWMASGRTGTIYYSTLAGDNLNLNLDVAVARSTDGGKTWSAPVPVFRPPFAIGYTGDKDALAVGPDPVVRARDNLYVAYDDFSFDSVTGQATTGLPVARSTDGGTTWQLTYADKFTLPTTGCSFQQYIGATPIVDQATGTLYVTAEKIAVNDPNCTGAPATFSESIFKSTDGGKTFGPGVKIADVTPATPDGLLFLGPGRYARTAEFPSPAIRGGTIYVAWNDGGQGGHSHIRLATSANGGSTWSVKFATSGSGDEVQPALSAGSHGLHLLYYHRYPNNTIDVLIGNSLNGNSFITKRVTSQPFRGTLTVPQFDPIIASGYMGDYIANVSDGSHDNFAWGDNRGTVTDFLYPHGRNDPDVFFAKQ
jgi:hypothetical protein